MGPRLVLVDQDVTALGGGAALHGTGADHAITLLAKSDSIRRTLSFQREREETVKRAGDCVKAHKGHHIALRVAAVEDAVHVVRLAGGTTAGAPGSAT